MTEGLGNLRVLSLNVNGLQSSRAKRLALFQWLAELQVDIAVLLETHCRDDRQAERWVQEGAGPGTAWNGLDFWQHFSSASRGVGILVRQGVLPAGVTPAVEYADTAASEPSTRPLGCGSPTSACCHASGLRRQRQQWQRSPSSGSNSSRQ